MLGASKETRYVAKLTEWFVWAYLVATARGVIRPGRMAVLPLLTGYENPKDCQLQMDIKRAAKRN